MYGVGSKILPEVKTKLEMQELAWELESWRRETLEVKSGTKSLHFKLLQDRMEYVGPAEMVA